MGQAARDFPNACDSDYRLYRRLGGREVAVGHRRYRNAELFAAHTRIPKWSRARRAGIYDSELVAAILGIFFDSEMFPSTGILFLRDNTAVSASEVLVANRTNNGRVARSVFWAFPQS